MTTNRAAIFLTGLGVGAVAAVLLAPTSGDDLRKKISDGANKTRDRLSPGAIKDSLSGAIQRGQQALNDKFSPGNTDAMKSKVHDGIDDAAQSTKKVADRAIDKSTEMAHQAGRSMERAGKRLQEA